MATVKKNDESNNVVGTNITPNETAVKDPNEKIVELTIPAERRGKNRDVIISVNGRDFQIKRGQKVKVPLYVKKAYECSLEQQAYAYQYEEEQSGGN